MTRGLVDLHCHILPGIDDGAADLADSVAMARQAEADGIGTVCATPHIRHDHDVRAHELARRVAELNEELACAGVAVTVAVGGEVAETALDGLGDDELRAVSLGDGGWVLLEPAPGELTDALADAVERLRARGYRALVAHPERHGGAGLRDHLRAVVSLGGLVQWTAAVFLAESAGAAWALEMAGEGLVHVLGSDAHTSRWGRRVELRAALDRLATATPHVDWIAYEAPQAILRGEKVEPPRSRLWT